MSTSISSWEAVVMTWGLVRECAVTAVVLNMLQRDFVNDCCYVKLAKSWQLVLYECWSQLLMPLCHEQPNSFPVKHKSLNKQTWHWSSSNLSTTAVTLYYWPLLCRPLYSQSATILSTCLPSVVSQVEGAQQVSMWMPYLPFSYRAMSML